MIRLSTSEKTSAFTVALRLSGRAVLVFAALMLIVSCESLESSLGELDDYLDSFVLEPGAPAMMTLPAMENNSSYQLEAGRYHGATIIRNSVDIRGAGTDRTVIDGRLIISGNNVTIRRLAIDGAVLLRGNNIDLTNTRITGAVRSSGSNNSW
jgi:hypothetical protein